MSVVRQLVDFAREARLNDSFMTALAPLSAMTSAVLMTLLALIASLQVLCLDLILNSV